MNELLLDCYMGLLIFANSIYAVNAKHLHEHPSQLYYFFGLRGLVVGSFLELLLLADPRFFFHSNYWFLVTLAAAGFSYTTLWHIYYVFKKQEDVLLAAALIDLFLGAVGFYVIVLLMLKLLQP
ncbi:MAG: hypothetical protein GXO42_02445 [bacterium]|nr:hypothetical protein [bacterium]